MYDFLSGMTAAEISRHIANGDAAALTVLPGVGREGAGIGVVIGLRPARIRGAGEHRGGDAGDRRGEADRAGEVDRADGAERARSQRRR